MIPCADLSKNICASQLNPDMLIGKYIPNLIAKPFDVTCKYAQLIYDQTSSPCLDIRKTGIHLVVLTVLILSD
jgi:hypothetical protein